MKENVAEKELSNEEKAKLFEDLLIGQGGEDFQLLEKRLMRFCPFEAIGMVRQEIRHAHFLSFILDPNKPHPFKDGFLKAFLLEIAAQAEASQFDLQPLDIHFLDGAGATILRERSDIDLLIEIPAGPSLSLGKGLVVTIELKVESTESKHQLSKYRRHVLDEYPAENWSHAFVFLTLDGTDPSQDNMDAWVPVSLASLIDRLDIAAMSMGTSGKAIELYQDYSSMIRRHLVEDEELAQLAKRIWTKHRTALEELYDFWPDLQAEVLDWLSDNFQELSEAVKSATGYTLEQDTSGSRILRFAVKEWKKIPGFCEGDKSWVSSASLIVLELADWGSGKLKLSLVLGPGNADTRSEIYESVLLRVDAGEIKIGRRTATPATKWKHLSAEYVQSEKDYAAAEDSEMSGEDLGKIVIKKMAKFLKKNLETYHGILSEVLEADS